MHDDDNRRVVWSSETGAVGPKREKRPKKKQRGGGDSAPSFPDDGTVRVRRETKGRGGKAVTAIYGLPGDAAAVKATTKSLKAKCGVGGSTKNGVVLLQGDHVDTVLAWLGDNGHRAKKAGG